MIGKLNGRYRGVSCLVTGGLGFIGSNLVLGLVQEGAHVTIVDSAIDGCGANYFNIHSVRNSVRILECDIGDVKRLQRETPIANVIFNVAGEISHTMSMSDPERDLAINTCAQLRFLLFCREYFRGSRVVYASTRQTYGKPVQLPVDEGHPIQPIDFNGVHKSAACQYHLVLSRRGELDCVVLRLSNVYGPRMALRLPQQGVLNVYLRNALENDPLVVYGDGMQLRDPVFVGDVVEAFLLAGIAPTDTWRVYNIGGPESHNMAEIANMITRATEAPPISWRPFPADLRTIEIGSYVSDTRRARLGLGWQPVTTFAEGIHETVRYYRECLHEYSTCVEMSVSTGK